MEPHNVECDLRSLRRLYGLLLSNAINEQYLLDENTQLLLKRLLDSGTEEILARQAKILAQAQLGSEFSQSPIASSPTATPSTSSQMGVSPAFGKTRINSSQIQRIRKGTLKRDLGIYCQIQRNPSSVAVSVSRGFTEEVSDSMERIETQISALRFAPSRVDRTRPAFEDYETRRERRQQSFEASTSGLPMSKQMIQTPRVSKISPSLASVNTVKSRDDRTLPLQSQGIYSPADQFVRRPPLPSLPVAFKKPSQSNRTSQKMASMKPTLLDQETGTWDEEESGTTESRTTSEDQELVSTEQDSEEAAGEIIGSSSGSSWETQGESVTESVSSSPPQSDDDDSEVSASPPRTNRDRSRDPAKQRKKAMGRFKRFKDKLGQVFHHHHHHHYHHHHHEKEEGNKTSAWRHLQRRFHQKDKEKSVERRRKSESKGLTTHKQRGGQFQALVKGLMRHRRHSKKQKHKLQSHGRKRQGGRKFPNTRLVKLGKKHYFCKKDQEHEEK